MDFFKQKDIVPMLVGAESGPFQSPDFYYELKLEGERCIAYLSKSKTVLRGKNNYNLLHKYPELGRLHRQVSSPCILDGEIVVGKGGSPDFFDTKRRTLLPNASLFGLDSKGPATFVAFDVLFANGTELWHSPLVERRAILSEIVQENRRIELSRVTMSSGVALYELAEINNLEGIIAKHKQSLYIPGRRNGKWIKIKLLSEEEYVICGYIIKENFKADLVLGKKIEDSIDYAGMVRLDMDSDEFDVIRSVKRNTFSPFELLPMLPDGKVPFDSKQVLWLQPILQCGVRYSDAPDLSEIATPVFVGLRSKSEPEITEEFEE